MSVRLIAKMASIYLVLFCSAAWATPLVIDWQTNGGLNVFEREAITFDPVQVNSFSSFYSDGTFHNMVNTSGADWFKALINIRLGDEWVVFAENENIRGLYNSEFPLDDFIFFPVDFSKGQLSGIFFATTGFGQSEYLGMTSAGTGTGFTFEFTSVPEPGSLVLLALGLALLVASERRTG